MKGEIKEKELLEVTGGARAADSKSKEEITVQCGQFKSKDECSKIKDCSWSDNECKQKGLSFEF